MGFGFQWHRLIKASLTFARTSILVNGSPTSEFLLKRGLRQEDPLSRFLFIIVMEGLHIALKDGIASNMFSGVKILNVFYIASGLKINVKKSNLYGVGVYSGEIESLAYRTGCMTGSLPFSYLGLPMGSNMSQVVNWKIIINQFKARLSTLKASLLYIGGRLTLIKSVLGSLGIYQFLKLHASFFRGASDEKRKLAWTKWPNILASFDKGGLCVSSLKDFNISMLLKWRWRLLSSLGSLWVKVVKSIHGDEAGIDLRGCQTNGLWASIVGTINHLHLSCIIVLDSIRFNVGDGSLIRFWKDTWLGDSPLFIRYNRLYRLERDKNCLIRDSIVNGCLSWDWYRPLTNGRSYADFYQSFGRNWFLRDGGW